MVSSVMPEFYAPVRAGQRHEVTLSMFRYILSLSVNVKLLTHLVHVHKTCPFVNLLLHVLFRHGKSRKLEGPLYPNLLPGVNVRHFHHTHYNAYYHLLTYIVPDAYLELDRQRPSNFDVTEVLLPGLYVCRGHFLPVTRPWSLSQSFFAGNIRPARSVKAVTEGSGQNKPLDKPPDNVYYVSNAEADDKTRYHAPLGDLARFCV